MEMTTLLHRLSIPCLFIGRLRKIGMPSLIHTVGHVGYMIRESSAPSGEPQK
jgi:hypothetical protein